MILTLKADQIVPFLESLQKTDVQLRIYKQISTVSSEYLITISEIKKKKSVSYLMWKLPFFWTK